MCRRHLAGILCHPARHLRPHRRHIILNGSKKFIKLNYRKTKKICTFFTLRAWLNVNDVKQPKRKPRFQCFLIVIIIVIIIFWVLVLLLGYVSWRANETLQALCSHWTTQIRREKTTNTIVVKVVWEMSTK